MKSKSQIKREKIMKNTIALNKKGEFTINTSTTLDPVGIPVILDNVSGEYFFALGNLGKKLKKDRSGKIYSITKELRDMHGVMSKEYVHLSIMTTVAELETLLKKAKKNKKDLKGGFFLHFNPNLSFLFEK